MQISVKNPEFTEEFLILANKGDRKGCGIAVFFDEESVGVIVSASGRVVGRFEFVRDENSLILDRQHIVEREFYPLEFAIQEMVRACKRKKILAICWM
jgi:hypothetical protein